MDNAQKGRVLISETDLIRLAAEAGAKAYAEERKRNDKKRKNNRLHNIDILLKNYRSFKAHAENAVFDIQDIYTDELAEIEELMWETGKPEVIANAIFKSATRTKIIIAHIDTAIASYEKACFNDSHEAQRRCRNLKRKFIDEKVLSVDDIAECEHIDASTVRRDITKAKHELTAFLFGIDGIL